MDSAGEGVSGVVITITDRHGEVVATTTTDEHGDYRFRNLAEGEYTVTAHPRRQEPVVHTVAVSAGVATQHDFVLGGGCQLTGRVRRNNVRRTKVRTDNVQRRSAT